jgi:hypothetical protein
MVGGCRPAHQRPSNKLIFYKMYDNGMVVMQEAGEAQNSQGHEGVAATGRSSRPVSNMVAG